MRSCELTLFSVALCKCPLKGTEISSRKWNGRQNANTHFWQEQSSEQPQCGVTWTRGESQSGERGGLQNGRDERGVEAAPAVLRGQREGELLLLVSSSTPCQEVGKFLLWSVIFREF